MELNDQKPDSQLATILRELPMLNPIEEPLRIVLTTNYNLQRYPDARRLLQILKVLNRWDRQRIDQACRDLDQALEDTGGILGEAFYGETQEQGGAGGFGKEAVTRRFGDELDEQGQLSEKARGLLLTVTNVALALNLADPTQVPPTPPTQIPRSSLLIRLKKPLERIRLPSLFVTEEKPTPEETPVGWTTPPVWKEEDQRDFELLETIGMVVLDESVQDKWEALRAFKDWSREEIERLLKTVADIALKQANQSKLIVENVTESRDQFMTLLDLLFWIKDVNEKVLSSLPAAA